MAELLSSHSFLGEAAIQQALRLSFAAEIGSFGKAPFFDKCDRNLNAEITLQTFLKMRLQAVGVLHAAKHFNADGHVVADDTIRLTAVDDAKPFARGALITFYRSKTSHRIDVHAAQLDHVVTAAKKFVHPLETATAFACFG